MQFDPLPPMTPQHATESDIAMLEALVARLGWEEIMYRLGVLITKQAKEATGPHKGALEAASSLVNLWGPSFHYCNEQVCLAQMRKD